jgi:hypothetical protein
MLGWLGRIFGGRPLGPDRNNRPIRRLVPGDAGEIEAALRELPSVGLRFFPGEGHDLRMMAKDIAKQWQGIYFGKEPTFGHWALIAMAGDPRPFENAIRYDDHCFDGVTMEDHSSMVAEIIGLAGDEWPIEGVEVMDARRPEDGPLSGTIAVAITDKQEVSSFELRNAKDFDWSIIFRLNERLPNGASGRFAIFLDGSATIVFLTPDQIRQLNSLCGYEFFYKEYPEDSNPETQNSVL